MDVTELAAELRTGDPDLPPAEAAFVEAVETTKELFDAGEIDREEYHDRIATASDRYRDATDADP
ncbi:hypothetical protein [Halalkalicoccus sp. NIPERK01]|uniref:hypothetical protein n=1 Tax=Halalkalicoccus sp. NIPERK01 TaxID=3053469 RepID=UPI00256EB919|nr:hypothetical protein [Halalkalicoccus sp. NIPERK01]MDL5362289.1 hypothetical protein [Halalkalicoccus sp. NIPERK01]